MHFNFKKQSFNGNFFTKLFKSSVFCMLLLIPSCSLVLTSCGDDDDDNQEVVSTNSVSGTWQSTHVVIWNKVGGEYTEDSPYEGNDVKLTLNFTDNQKFSMKLVDVMGDTDEAAGTYAMGNNSIKFNYTDEDNETEITDVKIVSFTKDELVLEYHGFDTDEDGTIEVYFKVNLKRVK